MTDQLNHELQENTSSQNPDGSFLNYIDEEIKYIQDEIQKPGWTIWAVIGGLASLGWILLGIIEKQDFSVKFSLALVLLINYAYSSVSVFFEKDLIPEGNSKEKAIPFSDISKKMGILKASHILGIIRLVSIIYITYLLRKELGTWGSTIAYIYNGLRLFLALILPMLLQIVQTGYNFMQSNDKYRDYPFAAAPPPMPTKLNFKTTLLMNLPLLTLSAYLFWNSLQYSLKNMSYLTIEDLRLASVIVGIYILLKLLTNTQTKNPILASLVEARRNYVMGRIDFSTTKKHVDIALSGLEISDVLQQEVSKLIAHIQNAETDLDITKTKIELLVKLESENTEQENNILIDSVNDSILNHLEQYKLSRKKIQSIKNGSFTTYANMYKMAIGDQDIRTVLEKIDDAISQADQKKQALLNNWTEVLSKNGTLEQWKEKTSKIE